MKSKKALVFLLLVVFFLYKPTTLGAILTPLAMAISLVLIIRISLKVETSVTLRINMDRPGRKVFFPIMSYYAYCFIQTLLITGKVDENQIKAMLSILCLVILYSTVFLDRVIWRLFCKGLIGFLCFQVISYLISALLSMGRSNVYTLELISIKIPIYNYNFNIYYPFTFATGRWTIFGHQFLRLSSMFRECGIAQLFYIWALSECKYVLKNYRIVQILLLLGAIFCFSTAGFLCLVAYYMLQFLINFKTYSSKKIMIRQLSIIIILVIAYWALKSIPGIRLSDKNIDSAMSRVRNINEVWSTFLKHPVFGTGDATIESTSTTFIQTIYRIGIVGTLLYLNILRVAYKNANSKKRFLLANIANILTLFFSQPIWDAPLVFLLLIMPYDTELNDKKPVSMKCEKYNMYGQNRQKQNEL